MAPKVPSSSTSPTPSTSSTTTTATPVRCLLAESGSYREQLTITPIDGQPGRFDVRVASWLESARDPLLAHHPRYRATLDRAALVRLHRALGALLEGGGTDADTAA